MREETSEPESEPELRPSFAASQSGPRPSIEDLLAQQSWVRSLAYRLVKDSAAADDLVQETWLAALVHPPVADRPLRPWLGQVVRNFARMRRRGEANRERREQAVARSGQLPSGDQLVERVETSRMLAKTVLALAEPYRTTVLLRYFEGLSSAEIARRTGVPSATVRWRLMRALDDLRTKLDDGHGGDRRGWCVALAPLCRTASVSSAALAIQIALSLATGVLVIGALWWTARWWLDREGGETQPVAGLELSSDSDVSPPGAVASADRPDDVVREPADALRGARTSGSLASNAAVVRARAVDAKGEVVRDALLRALSGASGAGGSLQGPSSPAGGGDRRVVLAFEPRDPGGDALCDLELAAPGYVPRVLRVRVPARASVELGDVELAEAGAVTGRVTGVDGGGLAGARVQVELLPSRWLDFAAVPLDEARYLGSLLDASVPSAVCGSDGSYRFDALPSGYVRLWASASGRVSAWSEPVAVRAGWTASAPSLVLAPPNERERIEGRVLDPDGAPVPFAEVEAARRSLRALFFRGEAAVARARADERGRFTIVVDPRTQCDLCARDGEGRFRPSALAQARSGKSDVELRLAAWRAVEVDVSDASGVALADARIELFDADGRRLLEPETRAAALSRIQLPHVPFKLRVSHADCASTFFGPFDPERVSERIACPLAELRDVRGFVRSGGAAVSSARIEWLRPLPERAHLAAPGWCMDGAEIAVRFERLPALRAAESDGDGQFQIAHPRLGRFFLRVAANGFADLLLGPLELDPARASSSLAVELAHGGRLGVSVRTDDPSRGAGTIVGISSGDGWLRSARAGADGLAQFEGLAAGTWQVLELARETERAGAAAIDAPIAAHDGATRGANPWTVEIAEGESAACELELAREMLGRIDGVLLFDGASPGPWLVHLDPLEVAGPGAKRAVAGLDPAGRFAIGDLPPGKYTLSIWNSGYRPVATKVQDVIAVGPGRARWSADLATGRLRGTNAPNASDPYEIHHVWRDGGALACTTRIEADATTEGGAFDLSALPAGRAQLVRVRRGGDPLSEGTVLLDALVPPGGELAIALPAPER